ncbi:conserved membrane protein of unknown function [Rhodovastum atsumiense]|uniref:Uncharacterized protein n=1 Tax=Rhodovastum atsumiense TaxID=504468 RepID=A0A5M6IXT5_9PROT|nr:hypothetical protein [Rhodovastum atsumiense]KAA5613092.1 hypothetical protein F1189_06970 [Rhodovastum atsumiense]CAH2600037.1 conserved membrane protein of unknown function [Rhodovastum atsumiense]
MAGSWGTALHGALLLARGRAEGLQLIAAPPEDEMTVAARSFWAAVLCLPAFLCLHLLDWAQGRVPMPDQPGQALVLDLLGYVVGWVGFALLSHVMAASLGRDHRWPIFITAWNWCNVVQYLILTGAIVPELLHVPPLVAQTLWLAAMGWALWLEWYATRLSLAVPGFTAALLVATDFTLGLFLLGFTESIR